MIQFAQSEYLYLFWLLPFLVLFFAYSQWRLHQREQQLGDRRLLHRFTPLRASYRPYVKLVLILLMLSAGILVLARPQRIGGIEKNSKAGIELMVMMDISQSMLAQDVAPSRLEKSKQLVSTLIEERKNDRVGLGIFAGEAYPLLPLTNDLVSAQLFLDRISCDMVSLQGTNLAAALQLASKSFSDNHKVGKAIVLITDGENHEEGARTAAAELRKKGILLLLLGVGTSAGGEIPTPDGWLVDNTGKIVRSSLNEAVCQEIASAAEGVYVHVDNNHAVQQTLAQHLNKLQRNESFVTHSEHTEELFVYPALLMLFLIVFEFLLFEKRNTCFKIPL